MKFIKNILDFEINQNIEDMEGEVEVENEYTPNKEKNPTISNRISLM